MARIAPLMTLLAAGTLAAGCAQTTAPLTAENNPSLYSVHQPVVQRTDYVLDLSSGGGGLPASEAGRLDGWFQGLQLGYGDSIFVDQAGGYSDPATRQDIAEVAGRYGLLVSDGAPVTTGAVQPGSVRVVVSRMTASVPGCPDWGHAARLGAPNATHSNYGCATNSNLAAMIADPADLIVGQGSRGIDAEETGRAIKSYRNRIQSGVDKEVKAESVGGK